jgi:hypothetical protein
MFLLFFTPWIRSCSGDTDTVTGAEALQGTGQAVFQLVTNSTNLDGNNRILEGVIYPIAFLGLVSIILYCILSVFIAFHENKLIGVSIWRKLVTILLPIGALGLSTGIYLLATGTISELLWGYWFTWINFFSIIGLEWKSGFSQETQPP